MTDPAAQPKLLPTDYSYFLDDDGDVWRRAPEDGPLELCSGPENWLVSHPGNLAVLWPLIIGKPPLPTEPGLYIVNYDAEEQMQEYDVVYLLDDGQLIKYGLNTPYSVAEGDTLTLLTAARRS